MDKHTNSYQNLPYFGFDFDEQTFSGDMSNKLFCTFVTEPQIEETVQQIKQSYQIIYNKIFVLSLQDDEGFICTYNVDLHNVGDFIENTILVHRKKHSNTLYTINALNQLIRSLNEGRLNKNFTVDWDDYRNSILLTRDDELQILKTELFSIIEVEG